MINMLGGLAFTFLVALIIFGIARIIVDIINPLDD